MTMDCECRNRHPVMRSDVLRLLRANGLEDATVEDVCDMLPLLTDDTALATAVRRYIDGLKEME